MSRTDYNWNNLSEKIPSILDGDQVLVGEISTDFECGYRFTTRTIEAVRKVSDQLKPNFIWSKIGLPGISDNWNSFDNTPKVGQPIIVRMPDGEERPIEWGYGSLSAMAVITNCKWRPR